MELERQMIKVGWGRADPIYRRVFTSFFIPGASETQMRWFDELQRQSMNPEAALATSIARANVNVTESAPKVTAPTLVLHVDDDRVVPYEEGRRLAYLIPGARLVARGHSNDECAVELSMSARTVERHLSNIYVKLAITGKSAKAAAAARLPELEHDGHGA